MKQFIYFFLVLSLIFGVSHVYAEGGSSDLKEIEDEVKDDSFLDDLSDEVKNLEDNIKDAGDFSDDDEVEIEVEVEHGQIEIKKEVRTETRLGDDDSDDDSDDDREEERERVRVKINGVEVSDWRATETKIILGEGKEIEVSSRSMGKFLGFIPVELRQTSTVKIEDGESEVKVKFPWWHIFVKKNFSGEELADEIRQSLELDEDTESIVEKILDIIRGFELDDDSDDDSSDESTDDNS